MLMFLQLFQKKGIARHTGENVRVASEELLGVCRRLASKSALTEEHVHDVITGLSIYRNSRFRSMFTFLAQAADIGNTSTVMPNIAKDVTPLEQIEALLEKAVNFHGRLAASGNWNQADKGGGVCDVAGAFTSAFRCWNCDKETCSVSAYIALKNRASSDANKKKFYTDSGLPVSSGRKWWRDSDVLEEAI